VESSGADSEGSLCSDRIRMFHGNEWKSYIRRTRNSNGEDMITMRDLKREKERLEQRLKEQFITPQEMSSLQGSLMTINKFIKLGEDRKKRWKNAKP